MIIQFKYLIINSFLYEVLFLISLTIIKAHNLISKKKGPVYYISSKTYGLYNNLIYRPNFENQPYFSSKIRNSNKNLHIIPISKNDHVYYIKFIKSKKFIGINESDSDSIDLEDDISLIENNGNNFGINRKSSCCCQVF